MQGCCSRPLRRSSSVFGSCWHWLIRALCGSNAGYVQAHDHYPLCLLRIDSCRLRWLFLRGGELFVWKAFRRISFYRYWLFRGLSGTLRVIILYIYLSIYLDDIFFSFPSSIWFPSSEKYCVPFIELLFNFVHHNIMRRVFLNFSLNEFKKSILKSHEGKFFMNENRFGCYDSSMF